MHKDVVIPQDLWEEDEEGVITSWLVSEGGDVHTGALIAELMVQKIQYEVVSPDSGKLCIKKDMDEVVNKGDVIATIEVYV